MPSSTDSPEPVSLAIGKALETLASHVASPDTIRRREEELARRSAVSWDRMVRRNMNDRGVPSHAPTRAAVSAEDVALTAPLLAVLRALLWRHRRRLPTGEAPGLLVALTGPHGCGKTVAGSWTAVRWPLDAQVVTARDLGEMPDSDWSGFVAARARWMAVDLLVVDDLGSDRERDRGARAAARFASLVLARYDAGRATVVSANVGQRDFCETYLATSDEFRTRRGEVVRGNEWLTSRLSNEQYGHGCPYWYEFDGAPDYRSQEKRRLLDGLKRVNGRQAMNRFIDGAK